MDLVIFVFYATSKVSTILFCVQTYSPKQILPIIQYDFGTRKTEVILTVSDSDPLGQKCIVVTWHKNDRSGNFPFSILFFRPFAYLSLPVHGVDHAIIFKFDL